MSRYNTIKSELDADPLGRGYAGMTPAQAAASFNARNRQRNRAMVVGNEVFEATVAGEYGTLTDSQKQQWLTLCSFDQIDPSGKAADLAVSIFGGGSDTIAALQAIRVETVTRGEELGLGMLDEADIRNARTL